MFLQLWLRLRGTPCSVALLSWGKRLTCVCGVSVLDGRRGPVVFTASVEYATPKGFWEKTARSRLFGYFLTLVA